MRRRNLRRLALAAVAAGSVLAAADVATATDRETGTAARRHRGHPDVRLDRLDFPKDVRGWWRYKKYLRGRLRQDARRANWGAGRGSRIEIRFAVKELEVTEQDGVVRVTCSAVGKLPKGKVAKSKLFFGGQPRRRDRIIRTVLRIVARGVVTRLAELERIRRGDLQPSRIRRPRS